MEWLYETFDVEPIRKPSVRGPTGFPVRTLYLAPPSEFYEPPDEELISAIDDAGPLDGFEGEDLFTVIIASGRPEESLSKTHAVAAMQELKKRGWRQDEKGEWGQDPEVIRALRAGEDLGKFSDGELFDLLVYLEGSKVEGTTSYYGQAPGWTTAVISELNLRGWQRDETGSSFATGFFVALFRAPKNLVGVGVDKLFVRCLDHRRQVCLQPS